MKLFHPILLSLAALVPGLSASDLRDIPLKDISGKETSLKAYQDKVLLIVNVASKCGNTPQYKQLQELHDRFSGDGLVVLGFPCNDFGKQEPGSNEEIAAFCSSKYGVTFPMFDKVVVKGEGKHPLYEALSGPDAPFPGDVKWNFGKFLVDREGKVIARFEPKAKPDSAEVVAAIETALKAP